MDYGLIEFVSMCIELTGVIVIVFGMLFVSMSFFHTWLSRKHPPNLDKKFRHNLERVILVGLEFLVAGDIIHSIAVTPTLESISVLGLIIAIRTVLSIELNMEIEGRWPWQQGDSTK